MKDKGIKIGRTGFIAKLNEKGVYEYSYSPPPVEFPEPPTYQDRPEVGLVIKVEEVNRSYYQKVIKKSIHDILNHLK